MEVIIAIIAVIVGIIAAFFKGKSTGKTEAKIDSLEKTAEQTQKVKESDNAVNSQDRNDIISGLLADSVRRPGSENR